jgi:hypothetical protein
MAELVDALGSGPSGGNTVEVRVLFWAPSNSDKDAPLLNIRQYVFICIPKTIP